MTETIILVSSDNAAMVDALCRQITHAFPDLISAGIRIEPKTNPFKCNVKFELIVDRITYEDWDFVLAFVRVFQYGYKACASHIKNEISKILN